jgi:hypothetical protein
MINGIGMGKEGGGAAGCSVMKWCGGTPLGVGACGTDPARATLLVKAEYENKGTFIPALSQKMRKGGNAGWAAWIAWVRKLSKIAHAAKRQLLWATGDGANRLFLQRLQKELQAA